MPGENEGAAQAILDQWEGGILVAHRAGPVEGAPENQNHFVGHQAPVHPPLDHPRSRVAGSEGSDEDFT